MTRKLLLRALGGCLLIGASATLHAQEITGFSQPKPAGKGHVSFVADTVEVPAGKPVTVELRFAVDPGFHINSHKPTSELLIPTALTLDPGSRLRVQDQEYPKGQPFHLSIGEGETLDVYQGEFRIRLRVLASEKGDTALTGTLRYQACDSASCFPPRTLAVRIPVTVR